MAQESEERRLQRQEANLYRQRLRKMQGVEHLGGVCLGGCGYKHSPDYIPSHIPFNFHHPDPETKEVDGRGISTMSLENMKAELDKCILLCSNCHQIIHFFERTGAWQAAYFIFDVPENQRAVDVFRARQAMPPELIRKEWDAKIQGKKKEYEGKRKVKSPDYLTGQLHRGETKEDDGPSS